MTHNGWFNGIREGVLGHDMVLFWFKNFVHIPSCHLVKPLNKLVRQVLGIQIL